MLEARLLPVGAVAIGDIDAHHGGDDPVQFRRLHEHAEISGEGLVSRRPTERDAEENFVADFHRLAADVVRVLDGADEPAAVVGDVEFPRQVVERAVIDDDLPHLLAERHHVDEFMRVDARRGIRGEIADVVRARPARVQAHVLDALHKCRRVLRKNEPHLQIRTRRDLHVTGGDFLCDVREFAKLERAKLPAGDAQSRHERLLHRREVKESVPFETESLLLVRGLVRHGVVEELLIRIQRVQFALHAFLEDEIVERGLRLARWIRRNIAKANPARGDSGEEPAEILLLLGAEGLSVECDGAHRSIDIALVAFRTLEPIHVGFRFVRGFSSGLFDHRVKRRVHILRHARGVATDVEMRAGFEP